jgi:hypothetical protein
VSVRFAPTGTGPLVTSGLCTLPERVLPAQHNAAPGCEPAAATGRAPGASRKHSGHGWEAAWGKGAGRWAWLASSLARRVCDRVVIALLGALQLVRARNRLAVLRRPQWRATSAGHHAVLRLLVSPRRAICALAAVDGGRGLVHALAYLCAGVLVRPPEGTVVRRLRALHHGHIASGCSATSCAGMA